LASTTCCRDRFFYLSYWLERMVEINVKEKGIKGKKILGHENYRKEWER
jgi:hypothetical protein